MNTSKKIFMGIREGTLSETQRKTYENVWTQSDAVNGMQQYYRAMPQLSPYEKIVDVGNGHGNGPVVAATQMKIPNLRISCPSLILWGEQDQALVKLTLIRQN
jgi:pimeloyl-ACP methyl ester carboxylesterase